MNTQQNDDRYRLVAAKIATPMWKRFKRILEKLGIKSSYTPIQNLVDVFIRFADDKHNRTPESEVLMSAFENAEGWDDNFTLADYTTNPEITEATYYLRDKQKKGVRILHVERPWMEGSGRWTQTWNVQQILEKFLCLTFPQLYRRLRFIAVCRDCNSILELLLHVVTEMEGEENKREFREPFEDAERSEWGRKPHEQRYKMHHRKSVNDMDSEQTTMFNDINDSIDDKDE